MTWSNQVAVVTGGGRGIGRATALLLARRGAAVCVNYAARSEAAEAVAKEINAAGGRAIAVATDVAEDAAVKGMINRVAAQLGPVTILVNNAGVSHQATLDTYDREQLERMRRDARTTALLVSARRFLADVETYFAALGDVPAPEPSEQPLPELLMELAAEAFDVANQVFDTIGGPGSSALIQYASGLRRSAEIYIQHQRRIAAEVLR